MTYPEEFKTYIRELAYMCRSVTNHDEYDMKLAWSCDPHPNDNAHSSTQITIKMDTVYLWVVITVYPAMLYHYEAGDLRGVAEDVLHELCHLFVEPVEAFFRWDVTSSQKDFVRDLVERQTQRICKAIFWSLPEDWYSHRTLEVPEPKQ